MLLPFSHRILFANDRRVPLLSDEVPRWAREHGSKAAPQGDLRDGVPGPVHPEPEEGAPRHRGGRRAEGGLPGGTSIAASSDRAGASACSRLPDRWMLREARRTNIFLNCQSATAPKHQVNMHVSSNYCPVNVSRI